MNTSRFTLYIVTLILTFAFVWLPHATGQPVDSTAIYLFPNENPVTTISVWKLKSGDNVAFREPSYNDTTWDITTTGILWKHLDGHGAGIRWYRQTIFIPEPLDSCKAFALYNRTIICANEVYWDGRILEQNGLIGKDIVSETPGKSSQFTLIPSALTKPGRHCIAIRVSNFHAFSGFMEAPLQIGYFQDLFFRLHLAESFLLLCAGTFLIASVFLLAIMGGRSVGKAYGILSALCLSSAIYLILDSIVHFFPTNTAYYYAIALINDVPWLCMMSLLPIFFLFEFAVPHRIFYSSVITLFTLACIVPPRLIMFGIAPIAWLDTFVLLNQFVMYGVTLIAASTSFFFILKKRKGSALAFLGCVAFLCGIFLSHRLEIEYAWALGFTTLIILLTLSLSRQMLAQNQKRQESDLRSARLELELLKKHIQPHFLLNSLNSIIAWLEENPPTAIKLVHALAEELRLILQFSKEKLVSLEEELQLCRLHLEVMGLRRDKQFILITTGNTKNDKVPPLVIHTLVENGLTHGFTGKLGGAFTFNRAEDNDFILYSLYNECTTTPGSSQPAGSLHEGTGLRYVKGRLEEAFAGKWSLLCGSRDNGWEVTIRIMKTAV